MSFSMAPATRTSASALLPARVALWHGARERGETGLEAAQGFAAFALFEIPSVPDFSAARFPDLAGLDEAARMQRVGQQQNQLLAALHALGPRSAVSLRYMGMRRPGEEPRLRVFVIGRSFGDTALHAQVSLDLFRETFLRSFPAPYRLVDWQDQDPALTEAVLGLPEVASLVEILKSEQTPAAWHDPSLCGFSRYYYPTPFAAAENDMLGFCRALTSEAGRQNVIVDITLSPTGPLTDVERAEVLGWGALCEQWGRDQRLAVSGGLYSRPQTIAVAADPHAQDARKAYNDLLQRYGSPQSRNFLYAIRVLTGEGPEALTTATALAARALAPGSAPQMRLLASEHPAFERAMNAVRGSFITPAVCNEPIWQQEDAPETLRRLHRMADIKEITGFFRLPIPGRDGCPGLPLDTGLPGPSGPKISPNGPLQIGHFVEGTRVTGEEAFVSAADLAKHALIVGTPGSGKTTLCFSLLTQVWERQRIPFLALEPAKTEYRALQQVPGLKEDLLVFTVGNERIAPFRFNPFEILEGESVSEHISSLNTCFAGAFNLFDPLPMLLDGAIREVYEEKGWSEYGVGGEEPDLEPPTLSDLYAKALTLAEASSYKGETAANIRGALQTRLGSLLRGPKGRCFNTRRSLPMDLLMGRPVVLELEALNDEEKALMMLFLLTSIRAYARTTRRSGSSLTHLVLVEEAHNVIGRGEGPASANKANPKEVAVRYFVRMLAEMRALGEGMVIADQLPTAIAPEAIKSTNLKVMHRVVAAEDRKELGETMVLDAGQFEQAATLSPGQSFVYQEGISRSRLVVEPDFKARYGVDLPPLDTEVQAHMAPFLAGEALRSAYLPYASCSAGCRRCDPRVREQTERWVQKKRPIIDLEIGKRASDDPTLVAFEEYLHNFEAGPEEKVRWHCAHVHFQQQILPALRTQKPR